MASPGDLVAVIAKSLGVPPVTVAQHDRALAEAGRRTKGGRGLSAAKMTADDAAVLLIATVASLAVKDSVETVKSYGSMLGQFGSGYEGNAGPVDAGNFPFADLRELPVTHTCKDAIAAIIRGFSRLNGTHHGVHGAFARVTVSFIAPRPECTITISKNVGFADAIGARYSILDGSNALTTKIDQLGDLWQQRFFSDRTINAVGDLLRER